LVIPPERRSSLAVVLPAMLKFARYEFATEKGVTCVPGHYDPLTVLFSILTAVLAGFAAFQAIGHTRNSKRPLAWALIGGLVLGMGIWSMHFIGMLAWEPPFPLSYTLGRTVTSVVIAVAASCLAMVLVLRTKDTVAARLAGALVVGSGISAMHYIGMSALHFSPPPMWMPPWLLVSYVIAVSASAIAMSLLRGASAPGLNGLRRQVAGSLIIGVAVCGMHYSGMQAMMLAPGTVCLHLPGSFSGPTLARIGVGNALLFMLALLLFSFYDKAQLAQAAEAARHEAEQSRLRAEQLQAAGKIAASVAHEVNNPLEAVTNLLYLMETGELGAREREYLSMAQNELRRMAEITTHTLKFYRQQSAPEPVQLPELFGSALALFSPRIESRGITIERIWPPSLPAFVCRSGELRQVFANLVSNAIDALPSEGGRIRISIVPRPDQILIEVADNGRGIPDSVRERVFEPFFTTKGPAGTGLGLSISSEIITRHGGELTFMTSTEEGRSGTSFHITLPVPAASPMLSSAPPVPTPGVARTVPAAL
jgi:signal transduction histidine kinase